MAVHMTTADSISVTSKASLINTVNAYTDITYLPDSPEKLKASFDSQTILKRIQ